MVTQTQTNDNEQVCSNKCDICGWHTDTEPITLDDGKYVEVCSDCKLQIQEPENWEIQHNFDLEEPEYDGE